MHRSLRTFLGVHTWLCITALGFAQEEESTGTLRFYETAPVETQLAHPDWPRTDQVWIERIDAARKSLELAHFYASDRAGSRLGPVIESIERAAARGVQVRFLADAKFHETYPKTLDRLGAQDNIELRLFDMGPLTGGVLHAKYMIVDDETVCLGSANFDWRSLEHIQELGVEMRSAPLAAAFVVVFNADWRRAAGEPEGGAAVQGWGFPVELEMASGEKVSAKPVFSPEGLLPDGARWDLPELVGLINEAQERVCVQLLSYKTTDREGRYFDGLESALRRAAARGCEVQLLLADWSKRKWTIEGLQSLQALPRISVKLATVPEASDGFIAFARVVHAKYLVCDGEISWIGTSNWSYDYFFASRNVGVVLRGAAAGSVLESFFHDGWESDYAQLVDPGAEYEAPRIGD